MKMDDRSFRTEARATSRAYEAGQACWARGCTAKTERRLTDDELTAMHAIMGRPVGSHTCPTHAPHRCGYCTHIIPWFDGSLCDWCDRYDDYDPGADYESP